MSAAWTSFKIGLFALFVVVAAAAVALALGIKPGPEKTLRFVTYFDESVAGLDVGAVVQYRGITIGSVDKIDVAPDGRRVGVAMTVDAKEAWMLDWDRTGDSGLRAQISAPGLTGVKMVDFDYHDASTHPPPVLPFATADNYVPAVPGTGFTESLARITDAVVDALGRVSRLVEDVHAQEVPARLAGALASLEGASADLRTTVRRVNRERIPDRTSDTLGRVDATIESMNRILVRVQGDGGVLSGAERATSSIDAFGARAAGATDELDRSLRDLGDAARAMRSLSDAIERDPDMLLKGRQKAKNGGPK